ncbi:hypothetical protein SNEBB_005109 [Seison nebaliae]|nr:hypothetical protein SNEBB_005109 [Seison nebaliae]
MTFGRSNSFNRTAKKQYTRLTYGFKRYGVLHTHKIVFDRNDSFDKAILLVIDISIFYIILALILIITFAVLYRKDGTNGNFGSIGSADENILGKRNPFKKKGCADPRFESLSSYHTACLPASPDLNRIVKYTDEYRLQILELHMKERRLVPASDMKRLYYDLHLEQTAERWAARCQFGHEYTSKYRSEPLYAGPVGQCMGKGVSGETVHDTLGAVGRFIAEKKYYRYGKMPIDGKEIGHYTMVIFSNASRVGCGESFCTTGSYTICNYFKSITGMDLELPYYKGKPCSRCPRECKCWQKMCDCGTANGQ